MDPPDPMNHIRPINHINKKSKDTPRQFDLSELVPNWYKQFLPDHFGRVEMKKPTRLSNNTSTT